MSDDPQSFFIDFKNNLTIRWRSLQGGISFSIMMARGTKLAMFIASEKKGGQMQIFSDALGATVDIPDMPRRIDHCKGKKHDPRRHLPNGNRLVAQCLF
jgi:hypothetical protein